MKRLFVSTAFLVGVMVLVGCKKEDEMDGTKSITLSFTGLEDLGTDYAYEGWLIVDGKPVTAGIFNVDSNGVLSQKTFELSASDVENASAYVLTIEPSPDSDPGPSKVHILGGNFSGSEAPLTTSHSSAIGTDFTSATGSYFLATPTDGSNMTNENSGVWWQDLSSNPGLSLPSIPSGWKYEGWAVIGGVPVSTGTFTEVDTSDESAIYSETAAAGPSVPGEDFLINAPSGLTFPTDLSGATVVISVEPFPDNSPEPFLLKPLVGSVPASAMNNTLYNMNNNATATNPTGTVCR